MQKIRHNLELLSIHIPKTAGSSFQKTLESVYGEDAFMRLDYTTDPDDRDRMTAKNQTSQGDLDRLMKKGTLDENVRILHGHIHYDDFERFFDVTPELKVITWLRDPIQRIVSNYNYLRARFEAETRLSPVADKLFNRLVMSLTDFARLPRDVHMYRDYTRGRDLKNYDFIGITEDYDYDVRRLGKIMGWKKVPSYHINRTQSKPFQPGVEELEQLKDICAENIAIYEESLGIKKMVE